MMYGFAWDTSSPLAYAISILPILGIGLIVTLEATVCGFAIAMVVGLLFALLRRANSRLITWPVGLIVEFLRDTPLLIQLFFLFYALPDFGIVLPAFLTGALALGLQYSAYTSEVFRAGLDAIGRGQWEAATALNLSRARTYRDVVIPQAIPRIVPALGNYLVALFKETPLLSAIAVLELMQTAKIIGSDTFRYTEPMTLVGLFFLVMSLVSAALIRVLERLLNRRTSR